MISRFILKSGRSVYNPVFRRFLIYRFSQLNDPKKPSPEILKTDLNTPPTPKPTEGMYQKPEEEDKESQQKDSSNTAYILGGGAILMCLFYVMMQMQTQRSDKKANKFQSGKVQAIGKADIGGDWKLIDTKGNIVTSNDFKGQYYLMYFGFCNCPDICPNSLTKLKKSMQIIRKLPESKAFKLRSIFVSVDPDRDTPEKIDKFLSYFDKEMIGLTAKSNNDPLLKDCLKKFKIYATKINFEDEEQHHGLTGYTIDHTILTYLIDDENNYLTHLGANLGEHDLAKEIMSKIKERERQKLQAYKV